MISIAALLALSAAVPPSRPAPMSPSPARAVAQSVAPSALSGVVRDPDGAVVAGAVVLLRTASGAEIQTVTTAEGLFTLPGSASGPATLIVRAPGFADERLTLGTSRSDLVIALRPASLADAITVTPSRTEQRMSDVPASVNVIARDEIRQSPAVLADDLLRKVPTFSLFRRTSSIVANPTTQGVSLRGIGPSGVSRTLVLVDGVPVNDPFGGWVYWTRVPLESADRIEMVEGTSSSLYGNYAMGGVINVVTAAPARRSLEIKPQYGSLGSPKFDFSASDVWGRVGVVVSGSRFRTDGYFPVAETERGKVDTKASVDFRNLNLKVQYDASERIRAFFRSGYFEEDRNNGKSSTFDATPEANHTRWTSGSGGVTVRLPGASTLEATVFGDSEVFRANFLAVTGTPARSIGRMTLNQRVPTTSQGGMVQWSRAVGASQAITAGSDWRWVTGDSQEDGLDATTGLSVTLRRVSGGRQFSQGFFLQDVMSPSSRLTVTVSGRVDRWRNYDAHNLETNVPSGTPTAGHAPSLPERRDTVFSPRAAALYHLTSKVSLWGSLGAGFRAPTLNELYRQFRVGTRLTLANNQLGPERLRGGEVGLRVAPLTNLTWRATWYDNRITNPVSNVTLGQSGATITLQRQNLGSTRVAGLQNDVEYRAGDWRVAGGYLYNRARVVANPANKALEGLFLPQVPRHRGSLEVTYANARWVTASLLLQSSGSQFDDDLNTVVVPGFTAPGLPKYTVLSFSASRALTPHLDVFVGGQNLLDRTYYVGTLPTTVGSPRMFTGGFRLRLGGR